MKPEMNEMFANPLSFQPVNFATIQMPSAPRMVLPDVERVPQGYTVDAEGLLHFCFYYPNAKTVSVRNVLFATVLHEENGFWVGEAEWGKGLVACCLVVDGSLTLSQFLPLCFSDNRPMNYVDIPDGSELRTIRNVPHGVVVQDFLKSHLTGNAERINIYLPPQYFTEPERRFPVLYLQHGIGENETAWVSQGRINFVLDNLLAAGKIVPFIAVMANGMQTEADEKESKLHCGFFHEFLLDDLMPYVESRYRVAVGRENHVMAGLSMGSIQTSRTAFLHPQLFRAIGLFSGFLSDFLGGYNEHLTPKHLAAFKASGTTIFRAMGDEDPFMQIFIANDSLLEQAGIPCDRRIYHGNHEWNVWRQCFVDFVEQTFPIR